MTGPATPLPNFEQLCIARQAANLNKYTIAAYEGRPVPAHQMPPQGAVWENAAMFRNNVLDILEELADAWNIAALLVQRIHRADPGPPHVSEIARALGGYLELLNATVEAANGVYRLLPPDFQRDTIPVERVLPGPGARS